MDSNTQLLLLYVASGCITSLLSLPLIYRKIPPNRWYGFRVPKTLSNTHIWYEANAEAGKRLAAAGLFIAIGVTIFYFLKRWEVVYFAVACLLITTLSLGYALVQSFRLLGKMKADDENDKP